MKIAFIAVALLFAFGLGFITSPLGVKKRTAMEEFMHSVHLVRAVATTNLNVLERLQDGAVEKARESAAQAVAGYWQFHRHFDDSPDKQEFQNRIEALREKCPELRKALEDSEKR